MHLGALGRLATPAGFQESSTFLILVQIEIAVRVDPDSMPPIPRASRGGTQPARQHLAIEVEEGNQAVQLRYVYHPVMVDIDIAGVGQVFPQCRDALGASPTQPELALHPGLLNDLIAIPPGNP